MMIKIPASANNMKTRITSQKPIRHLWGSRENLGTEELMGEEQMVTCGGFVVLFWLFSFGWCGFCLFVLYFGVGCFLFVCFFF